VIVAFATPITILLFLLNHGRDLERLLSLRISISLTNATADSGVVLHLIRPVLFIRVHLVNPVIAFQCLDGN
jgi:hypothetical protein